MLTRGFWNACSSHGERRMTPLPIDAEMCVAALRDVAVGASDRCVGCLLRVPRAICKDSAVGVSAGQRVGAPLRRLRMAHPGLALFLACSMLWLPSRSAPENMQVRRSGLQGTRIIPDVDVFAVASVARLQDSRYFTPPSCVSACFSGSGSGSGRALAQ